ncbi:MAG TPA: trypsin-like peptidase domain-containing protein [Pirellulales bacterium]
MDEVHVPRAPLPPRPRLRGLIFLAIILAIVLGAPSLAFRIEYELTRARLQATSEHAAAELSELDKNAELVTLSDTSRAFRLVAERIEPCVVHIDTEQIAREGGNNAFDEFFGIPGREYREIGQGSGVIVDTAGFILTNYHVIQGASQVSVHLSDGRAIDDVTLVGSDVLTDLAVLKINATGLTSASFGDSKQLQVGDWVLAIGNPYGLDRTVSMGIVSAKQRRAFAENSAYQDFLQTDAAVNPGNSGGPLVNIKGEVIGITTAIVGKAYQGISFAIPTEVVSVVYKHLKERGSMTRGYLGVGLQDLTPELARKLKVGETEGAVVSGVQPKSPADKAGLEPGDVVIEFNGEKIHEPSELRLLVAAAKVNSTAKLKIIRDGKERTIDVVIAARKGNT